MITLIFIFHCITMYLYVFISYLSASIIEKYTNIYVSILLKYIVNILLIILYFILPVNNMFFTTCVSFLAFVIYIALNGEYIISNNFGKYYYNLYFELMFFMIVFIFFIYYIATNSNLLCLWFYKWTNDMNKINTIYSLMMISCMFAIHCIRFFIRFLKNKDKDFLIIINDFSIF